MDIDLVAKLSDLPSACAPRGAWYSRKDAGGYYHHPNLMNYGLSWPSLVAALYGSPEFANLVPAVCHLTQTSYGWGTWPVIGIPLASGGFSGNQAQLQGALDSTPPGGTVYLAERAAITLSSTLVIPSGVTLATTGVPSPTHYANMARLARAASFNAPLVRLQSGAKLLHVWVDGQRGTPANTLGFDMNVMMAGRAV